MKYTARITAPSETDKHWLRPNGGGLNECIEIRNGSCLANCVGYAWGRWYEILGKRPNLARINAEDWFAYNDGYQRGQTPKVGAVACWSKGRLRDGSDGCGHVAIVEKVYSDGSILISESNYSGLRFRTVTLKKGYAYTSTLKFQGFIYLPIEFDPEEDEPKKEEPVFVKGKNYTLQYNCVVRSGPGTKYAKKTKAQLTKNAQAHAYANGCLMRGTVITCQNSDKDDKGNIWIKIPSGWVVGYLDKEVIIK